jgi:hypothetical protein
VQFFKSHLCLSWLHSHGFFIWLNYSSCQYKVELWQQTFVMPQLQSLAYGGKRFHYRNKVLWMRFRCDSLFVDLMEFSCNPQKDKVNMVASESPSNYKLQLWHYQVKFTNKNTTFFFAKCVYTVEWWFLWQIVLICYSFMQELHIRPNLPLVHTHTHTHLNNLGYTHAPTKYVLSHTQSSICIHMHIL